MMWQLLRALLGLMHMTLNTALAVLDCAEFGSLALLGLRSCRVSEVVGCSRRAMSEMRQTMKLPRALFCGVMSL